MTERLRSHNWGHLISDGLAGWHCNIRTSGDVGRTWSEIHPYTNLGRQQDSMLAGGQRASRLVRGGTLYKYFILQSQPASSLLSVQAHFKPILTRIAT